MAVHQPELLSLLKSSIAAKLNHRQLGGLRMQITIELGQFKDATCL